MTLAPDYAALLDANEAIAALCRRDQRNTVALHLDDMAAAIRNLVAEREGLREALEPFALNLPPIYSDDSESFRAYFTVGQIKEARAALSGRGKA